MFPIFHDGGDFQGGWGWSLSLNGRLLEASKLASLNGRTRSAQTTAIFNAQHSFEASSKDSLCRSSDHPHPSHPGWREDGEHLPPLFEFVNEVKSKAQQNADQDTGGNREVETEGILFDVNVAGKSSQKGNLRTIGENQAKNDQHHPYDHHQFTNRYKFIHYF